MVNGWKIVELYGPNRDGEPRRYTIADATQVSQGALLTLTDARTATKSTGASKVFAGIAAMDKVANDGSTSISCWTQGIFDARASGAGIFAGAPVTGAGGANFNDVKILAGVAASGAAILGYALEDADSLETINVRLNL